MLFLFDIGVQFFQSSERLEPRDSSCYSDNIFGFYAFFQEEISAGKLEPPDVYIDNCHSDANCFLFFV